MDNRNSTLFLMTILIITGIQGCDSDNDPVVETTTTMPAPGANPTDDITMDGLAGTWTRGCTALADSSNYSTTQLDIADNVSTLTESFFTDNGCSTAASPAVVITDSSLVFDNTMATTTLGQANLVESTVESKTIDGASDTDGINTVTYNIMLITNNTLYYGDTSGDNNGSTAALRPTTLDQTYTFSNL